MLSGHTLSCCLLHYMQADGDAKPSLSAFGIWRKQWLPALVELFCRGEGSHARGLHYFLLDVCLMLLRWSTSAAAASPPPGDAGAMLIRHLVRGPGRMVVQGVRAACLSGGKFGMLHACVLSVNVPPQMSRSGWLAIA